MVISPHNPPPLSMLFLRSDNSIYKSIQLLTVIQTVIQTCYYMHDK